MKEKRITYLISSTVLLLVFTCSNINAQNQEDILKTAYIEKFANYIEWPKNTAFENNQFSIVIIGDNELCNIVKTAFQNRNLKNMDVHVQCYKTMHETTDIDLLMLVSDRTKDLDLVMDICSKDPFLLVTSSDGFARKGSHINFFITAEQTLHFEMNKASLDGHGFEVDFLLLDFAKVVKK